MLGLMLPLKKAKRLIQRHFRREMLALYKAGWKVANQGKAIKRSMFNRAKPEVLRAKMLYSGLKWDWNYHPN